MNDTQRPRRRPRWWPEDEPWPPQGRMRFLGAMGLLVNGANLMLILAEGTYIFFLRPGLGA